MRKDRPNITFDELHDKSLFYMISELSYNGRGWRDYCVNGRKGE